MNDAYFNLATYDNPSEKAHVVCQEIGHTFGLTHQDESGADLNTCMDYFSKTGANATNTDSTHPNLHDHGQPTAIYSHTDSYNSYTARLRSRRAPPRASHRTGRRRAPVPARGRVYLNDLPDGGRVVTFIY